MPYDANRLRTLEDDDEAARAGRPTADQMAGAPMASAAMSAPAGPAAGSLGAAPVSRFVNFGRRFELNQEGANQMAGGLASGAEKKGTEAEGNIIKARNAFQQKASDASLKYQDPMLQLPATYKPAGSPEVSRQGSANEATRPGAAAPPSFSPGDAPPGALTRDEVQRRAQTTYGGPNSLAEASNWSDLQKQAGDAQKAATQLGSSGGIQAALGYTGSSGNSRLDSALAGTAGGSRFDALQKRFGTLSSDLDTANEASKGFAQRMAGDTAGAAGQYADYLGKYDAESAARLKPPDPIVVDAANSTLGMTADPVGGLDFRSKADVAADYLHKSAASNKDVADYQADIQRGWYQNQWPPGFTPPPPPKGISNRDDYYRQYLADIGKALRAYYANKGK